MKQRVLLVTILIMMSFAITGQPVTRRHFIIAYDVSTPFINAERRCQAYKQALIDLFSNNYIEGFEEADQDNLLMEKNNNVIFFDRDKDNISFFHFNVARSEFIDLRKEAENGDEAGIISSFTDRFIKDKVFTWETYKSENSSFTTDGYIQKAFEIQPEPASFGDGVSMSNFVYPLILDKMDTKIYAEEYILILLSDFLTGAMLGNTQDLDRVRDIYSVSYNKPLSPESPVAYVKKRINYLASQYYKLDYFQYSFLSTGSIRVSTPVNARNRSRTTSQVIPQNRKIAIIAYKIKPKIGVLTPQDVALFMDSDFDLKQKNYQGTAFKTSEAKIKFSHNKNLVPVELQMTIVSPENEQTFFDDVIATKDTENNWVSGYTSDIMRFDEKKLTYNIPELSVDLASLPDDMDMIVRYQFITRYEVPNMSSLGFIYKTERLLPAQNIHFKSESLNIIIYYVLPSLGVLTLLIIIILLLARLGKPKGLNLNIVRYLDSFEKIDFQTVGKMITDYKKWDSSQLKEDFMPVSGAVEYKSKRYWFNWRKSKVRLELKIEDLPAGFELFIKRNDNEINEYYVDTPPLHISQGKNGKLSFLVGIRKKDITKRMGEPELVKFSVEAVLRASFLFIKSEIRRPMPYLFNIGADLQDVWVSFDPGTTGSCVAVGSEAGNIRLLEENKNTEGIIPSVITFETNQAYNGTGSLFYDYGTVADSLRYGNTGYTGFKSIKKMLGFKTEQKIQLDNGTALSVKGKYLASLLVQGLYEDTRYDYNYLLNTDDYLIDGDFNPLRAVVTIPNNFTANKIQDTVDCIASLQQFKEIRCVYEAEAILFYYLSTHSTQAYETILVFDMGGATINATVATVKKIREGNNDKYEINILGKIGYGIGGDTIDYCIIKFLMDFPDEYAELSKLDIFKNKATLSKLAFSIKLEIIRNYYLKGDYLITENHLVNLISNEIGLNKSNKEKTGIVLEKHTDRMYSYFLKNEKSEYPLFSHPIFTDIIYNNVKDAVQEVLKLAGKPVDKVIFSGRSTVFPLIKETVKAQLDSKCGSIDFGLVESKTAVAKGACWYGIHRNAVKLQNLKTTASFGFRQTVTPNGAVVKFHPLVAMGLNFNASSNGTRSCRNKMMISDAFSLDGNKVNFYQIMGKDADAILSQDQRHKYSKIATIRIDQPTTEIAMQVKENDEIDCWVRLISKSLLTPDRRGAVADQEINEANAEHYAWIVT